MTAKTTADHPEPVTYHWIMTGQTNDGRQGTKDGRISVVPGLHTCESSYQAIRKSVGEWLGTDEFTVAFFSLTPNQL